MGCCFSTGAMDNPVPPPQAERVAWISEQRREEQDSGDLMAFQQDVLEEKKKPVCGICMDEIHEAVGTGSTNRCYPHHTDCYHPACLQQHIAVKLEGLQVCSPSLL